jgi:hypothetical protein
MSVRINRKLLERCQVKKQKFFQDKLFESSFY